jgi:hypothetical protein
MIEGSILLNYMRFYQISILAFLMSLSDCAVAHDGEHHGKNASNPRGVEVLDFHVPNIDRVISAGYPVSFGVYAFSKREKTELLTIDDNIGNPKHCVKANFLAFDVNDDYAFDINEDVSVKFLIDRLQTKSLVYGFDQHGSEKANGLIEIDETTDQQGNLVWVSVTFNKARFANRGISNTDFVLTTNETMLYEASLAKHSHTTFVLCDVAIINNINNNSHRETTNSVQKSKVNFNFIDDNRATPVRFGLYDSKGSAVLLNNTELSLPFYEDKSQQHSLPAYSPPYQFWPHDNRYYSYVDSHFSQVLEPDTYTLIATKGPEYRINKKQFIVKENQASVNLTIKMDRWMDLPSMGWYSGDVHIHIEREEKDNENLVKVLEAEDIHFSNLLEMSTNETDHYKQYSFGEAGIFTEQGYSLVPGIEGPRTAHRGHSIALNVKEAFKQPDSFFLYHKYFDFYKQQKALIGYAHVGSKEFNASLGLALDMPFGLIDFVEVMQNQRLRTKFWYEFLNLGYKLAPAAGSDYPYFEQPGAVRSYVKMPVNNTSNVKNDTVHAWYQQLKNGNTYVSNLPYLALSVNGKGIGSQLDVETNPLLNITARIAINSDYDTLSTLELIHCGKVIKQVKATEKDGEVLSFQYQIPNDASGWLALRGKGNDYALAHTGAIYLEDNKGSSSCKNQVPELIDIMLARLETLKHIKLDVNKELEFWETTQLEQTFGKQKDELENRLDLAKHIYQKMKADLLSSNNIPALSTSVQKRD